MTAIRFGTRYQISSRQPEVPADRLGVNLALKFKLANIPTVLASTGLEADRVYISTPTLAGNKEDGEKEIRVIERFIDQLRDDAEGDTMEAQLFQMEQTVARMKADHQAPQADRPKAHYGYRLTLERKPSFSG